MANMYVVGTFEDADRAEALTKDLEEHGFTSKNIDIISRERGRLAGAGGAGAATERDIVPDLEMMGAPTSDALEYAAAVRQGRALVTVGVDNQAEAERVLDIMMEHHAGGPLFEQREVRGETIAREPIETGARQPIETAGEQVLPVVEEELKVGKRTVERGRVRVYTRVTETPVEQDVTLREERVVVERRPTDRPATEAEIQEGRSVEVRETAEEPVVAKESHVVEEVVIGKEERERTEKIKETVRKTEVEIEGEDKEGKSEK